MSKIFKKTVVWKNLYFYRKSDAIYLLTVEFCRRFLPPYGDRTVDQMCRLLVVVSRISLREAKTDLQALKWRLSCLMLHAVVCRS